MRTNENIRFNVYFEMIGRYWYEKVRQKNRVICWILLKIGSCLIRAMFIIVELKACLWTLTNQSVWLVLQSRWGYRRYARRFTIVDAVRHLHWRHYQICPQVVGIILITLDELFTCDSKTTKPLVADEDRGDRGHYEMTNGLNQSIGRIFPNEENTWSVCQKRERAAVLIHRSLLVHNGKEHRYILINE